MNINQEAINLINAIENYIELSNKADYRFTIQEQVKIEKELNALYNHLTNLIQYELNKKED